MRLKASVLLAVLVVSTFALIMPAGVVHGISGTGNLAELDSVPQPNTVTFSTHNESVIAGSSQVTKVDGVTSSPSGVFAISFAGVVFSGSQFALYISTDGFSSVGSAATDISYGPTFSAFDFTNSSDAWKAVQGGIGLGLTGTFYIGTTKSGTPMVAGPVPMNINSSFTFIKIFDGSRSSVGVAPETLDLQAGLRLSSSSGAAGAAVTVLGGGFHSGAQVNINATYITSSWTGINKTHTVAWITNIPTGSGYFTTASTPMVDAKEVINPIGVGPYTTVPILLFAVDASHHSQVLTTAQKSTRSPAFREFSRGIAMVTSYSSTGTPVDKVDGAYTHGYLYGNDTGSIGTVGSVTVRDMATVNAQVFGKLYIAGNFSYVGQPVTFWIGSSPSTAIQMNTSAPVVANSVGFWNATVTVPVISGGVHAVWIRSNGMYFTVSNDVSGTTTTTTSTSSSTSTSTSTTTSSSTSTTTSTSSVSTTTTSTTTPTSTTTSTTQTTSHSSTTSHTTTSASSTSVPSTTTTSSSSSTSQAASGGISDLEYIVGGSGAVAIVAVASYLFLRGRRPTSV